MIDLGQIPEDEIVDFYRAYYSAFPEFIAYSRPILNNWTEHGTRLSFDKSLQAFVGLKLGYNSNCNEHRRYMPESGVLRKLRIAIESSREIRNTNIPGGRFFLSEDGIYFKDANHQPILIARWIFRISTKVKATIDEHIFLIRTIEKLRNENALLKLRKA